MVENNPPPQLTRNNWREQTGAGERTPALRQYSTSQGDKERNSLGPGRYDRTFVRYVANDDGTPIAWTTDQKLDLVIGLLSELLKQSSNPIPVTVESPSGPTIFETVPFSPIGIGLAAAYAALDAMGTIAVKVEVPKTGVIEGAVYYDRDDEGLPVQLWLFDDDVADQTDNGAYTLTDGDLLRVIDVIEFSSGFLDGTNGQVIIGSNLGIPYNAPRGYIWIQLQAGGALNIAAGAEPVFKLRIRPQ